MDDCVFCKIVKGEMHALKVYEDKHTMAFLDIQPIAKGHTLVIPKQHHNSFVDVPVDMFNAIMETAQKIGRKTIDNLGATGFNVGINQGKSAGQTVFHMHLHIIPRHDDDGLKTWPGHKLTDEEMTQIQQVMKQ